MVNQFGSPRRALFHQRCGERGRELESGNARCGSQMRKEKSGPESRRLHGDSHRNQKEGGKSGGRGDAITLLRRRRQRQTKIRQQREKIENSPQDE